MKLLDVKYYPNDEYRELFTVTVDSGKCTVDLIGITNDGDLLYVKERLANNSSAYWIDREFFSIDRGEFRRYLDTAKSNGKVEEAIKNHNTTFEELEKLAK